MRVRFALLSGLVLASATAAAQPARERVVRGDGIVPVTVNGAPGRVRIDPAAPALPIFTTPFATGRAQLRAGPFAFAYLVGPEQVAGRSAVGRIAVGEAMRPRKRRIGWTARAYAAEADGVIGPGGVPEPVVRFELRPPVPGERTIALPLEDDGGLFGGWGGSYAMIEVGGEPIRVSFNPRAPRTLASAGAAIRIANAFGGTMGGATVPTPIAFGISRPVRTMRLGTPLPVGGFALSELGVRTGDFGNASVIREEGGDPDEVIVAGNRRRNRQWDRVAIGADHLDRCSSITFDKRARQVRLACAAP